MRLPAILTLCVFAGLASPPGVFAAPHPCAADAVSRAKKLLRLHDEGAHTDAEIGDGEQAVQAAPVRAPKGDGSFDVLEVTSHIYKATYRLRFLYMRLEGCPLVGQEILEITGARG